MSRAKDTLGTFGALALITGVVVSGVAALAVPVAVVWYLFTH